jgi:uncharacterized membrane-anchored protein
VEQVLPGSGWWGEVAQTMYTNVSEYKNDKMKGEKKKKHTQKKKNKWPMWLDPCQVISIVPSTKKTK